MEILQIPPLTLFVFVVTFILSTATPVAVFLQSHDYFFLDLVFFFFSSVLGVEYGVNYTSSTDDVCLRWTFALNYWP